MGKPEPASKAYRVQSGDTLSGIVLRHMRAAGKSPGVSELYRAVERVASANDISNPDLIRLGQTIELPTFHEVRAPAAGGARGGIVRGETRISSEYGPRRDPINGETRFHRGVDIAAPYGSEIFPMRPGTVVFSGWNGGHGNTVIVRHDDGVETLYAHVSKNYVRAGERVRGDRAIARVGSTGRSTGPHLHFEVRRDGVIVDPKGYLGGASYRRVAHAH